jgi:two-component system NtrC family sensor kinase
VGEKGRSTVRPRPEEPGRSVPDESRALSHRLLHAASLGTPRVDFIRDASRMIMDFSRCDLIELWLREGRAFYRCSMTGPPDWMFGCEVLERFPDSGSGSAGGAEERHDLNLLAEEVLSGSLKPCPPSVTETGAFWTGDTGVPCRPKQDGDTGAVREYRLGGKYTSVAIIPLVAADQRVGLMQLKSRNRNHFKEAEMVFYERVGQNFALALVHQSAQFALRERVKELTCLYGITQVSENSRLPIETVLERIAELLPPAWQYPDIASAAVTLDGKRYSTSGFEDRPSKQTAEIVVHGETRGMVEVVYGDKTPDIDEGPFLSEERGLIDAVAKQVAMIIERRQAGEERVRLQEQLRHADRLATIGQLAAGVAHELNEPLGNILGFAQLALKTPSLPKQAHGDIEKIVKSCLHARQVIKKLMMFARQEPPRKVGVNLNELVQDGLFFLESRCKRQGIEVIRSLAPELPQITADASQLHQVLVNLVVNAIQAMPDGGKLTLSTLAAQDRVTLVVEDTGPGMSRDVMNKIFIPFFTTKDIGQGVGLGLAVVHGIVAGHRGTIEVHSEPGKGSRFEVSLPTKGPLGEEEVI